MPKRCLRCTISGKVQGVFFRANTQKQAQKLGITGWVRNLPTGEVEALICGEEDALLAMQDWLAKGPVLAQVTRVEVVEEVDAENCATFEIDVSAES